MTILLFVDNDNMINRILGHCLCTLHDIRLVSERYTWLGRASPCIPLSNLPYIPKCTKTGTYYSQLLQQFIPFKPGSTCNFLWIMLYMLMILLLVWFWTCIICNSGHTLIFLIQLYHGTNMFFLFYLKNIAHNSAPVHVKCTSRAERCVSILWVLSRSRKRRK